MTAGEPDPADGLAVFMDGVIVGADQSEGEHGIRVAQWRLQDGVHAAGAIRRGDFAGGGAVMVDLLERLSF